jgi:hypothetical protein
MEATGEAGVQERWCFECLAIVHETTATAKTANAKLLIEETMSDKLPEDLL